MTTHRIKIEVEGPVPTDAKSANYGRPTVFNVSMETDLTLTVVQQLATKLLTELTASALNSVK